MLKKLNNWFALYTVLHPFGTMCKGLDDAVNDDERRVLMDDGVAWNPTGK